MAKIPFRLKKPTPLPKIPESPPPPSQFTPPIMSTTSAANTSPSSNHSTTQTTLITLTPALIVLLTNNILTNPSQPDINTTAFLTHTRDFFNSNSQIQDNHLDARYRGKYATPLERFNESHLASTQQLFAKLAMAKANTLAGTMATEEYLAELPFYTNFKPANTMDEVADISFHLFPLLPPEIQALIWKWASTIPHELESGTKPLGTLGACTTSREQALLKNPEFLQLGQQGAKIYFNKERNVIYFDINSVTCLVDIMAATFKIKRAKGDDKISLHYLMAKRIKGLTDIRMISIPTEIYCVSGMLALLLKGAGFWYSPRHFISSIDPLAGVKEILCTDMPRTWYKTTEWSQHYFDTLREFVERYPDWASGHGVKPTAEGCKNKALGLFRPGQFIRRDKRQEIIAVMVDYQHISRFN
ncbi:hypothetical protein G7Y89_g7978 [Cudoniella acicularis]|uniref:2EXR domain-containing protein n=1 Tax=Cudoniella acicularis TaxID=354080 RepID=A0A8H4RJR1_9HELO|nr:hypothetical protein G7Y89_g7978 [Cudoniella acicularis]